MTFEEWFQTLAGVDDLKETFREAWETAYSIGHDDGLCSYNQKAKAEIKKNPNDWDDLDTYMPSA